MWDTSNGQYNLRGLTRKLPVFTVNLSSTQQPTRQKFKQQKGYQGRIQLTAVVTELF